MNNSNDRLGAALKVAKTKASSRKRRTYAFEDPETQARAMAIRLANRKPAAPTTNMRIETDAVKFCRMAWKDKHERVVETSSVLRKEALRKLGVKTE